MDESHKQEILDEARAHLEGRSAEFVTKRSAELVTKRDREALVYKTTMTERGTPEPEPEPEPEPDEEIAWDHRELLARAVAQTLDTAAKEARDALATEVRILNARIDDLRDLVSTLLKRGK